MKASKLTGAQNAFIIKQGEEGTTVAGICRKAGICQAGEPRHNLSRSRTVIARQMTRWPHPYGETEPASPALGRLRGHSSLKISRITVSRDETLLASKPTIHPWRGFRAGAASGRKRTTIRG